MSGSNDSINEEDLPPTQVADGADGLAMKCARRGCKRTDGGEVFCCGPDCGRVIHKGCYEYLYVRTKGLDPLPGDNVACTKKCYDRIKALGQRKLLWNEDGAGGREDDRTSERILLDWLLTPGNYAKYRGKNNDGMKKTQFALQIADLINREKVKIHRLPKDVINKIQHFEKTFKLAWDYAHSVTGAGLKEDDPTSFQEKIEAKCFYYYDLLPIMGDRSSNSPKGCSDDLDDDDNDDEIIDLQDPVEEEEEVPEDDGKPTGKTPNAAEKRKRSASPGTANVSAKKAGSGSTAGRLVSLLDEETQASIRELTQSRKAATDLETKQREMDLANRSLDYRMAKLDRLATIRSKYPLMSDEEIGKHFPELKEFMSVNTSGIGIGL